MQWPTCCQKPSGCVRQRRMRLLLLFVCVAVLAGAGVALARAPFSRAVTHEQESDEKLRLVHVVFRHGQRTPADTYPRDVYVNHTFHPYGWGQLTNVGRQRQFSAGVFLRKRFNSFLGQLYSSKEVLAQSTDPDRAHMSCALTLAGLWPPRGTGLDWSSELNWSPVPVRSQPLDEDTLLLARKSCPRYFEERDSAFKLPEIQQIFTSNADMFNELTEITGMPVRNPDDVQSLYSTLKAEADFGLPLPKWTEEYYPHKLEPLTEVSYILNAYNSELKKLKGGPLVKKLITDWTAKAEGTLSPKERKLFVYAGHDSTVSNLMLALGTWDQQIPAYGIMAIFELYENIQTNEFGVELFLRNSTCGEAVQLTIPGCEARCPLSKLIELTRDVVPKNWAEDCKSVDPNYVPPEIGGP